MFQLPLWFAEGLAEHESQYWGTEAGNRAADAAIQALGGYGYTKEYMVEKIKRDVRITTIYEGTSEIMEMTIAQAELKILLVAHQDIGHRGDFRKHGPEFRFAALPEGGAVVEVEGDAGAVLLRRPRDLQGLGRPGLVEPEVHEVQGVDDEHLFEVPGLVGDGLHDLRIRDPGIRHMLMYRISAVEARAGAYTASYVSVTLGFGFWAGVAAGLVFTAGLGAASERVAWMKADWTVSFVSGSRPAGRGSPLRRAANAGTRPGVAAR